MSDLFGLLPLPAPVPDEGAALTDPALDMVLAFVKAVINADLGDAWAARVPTDPLPVAYTFNHMPDPESFNMDELPAVYMSRADDPGSFRYSQDLVADDQGFQAIWVPPAIPQEDERFLRAFRNGFKKSLKAALAQGRHPAWVLPGDAYFDPADYGSVLLKYANIAKIQLGAFRQQPLLIESADKSFRKFFDAYYFTIPALEFFQKDLELEIPLNNAQGTLTNASPSDAASALPIIGFTFDPALTALDVDHGPEAGGTVVTITGEQFPYAETDAEGNDLVVEVLFGATAADPDHVTIQSETEITVTAPPGTGSVDVSVNFPSGVTKTLAGAFTYDP